MKAEYLFESIVDTAQADISGDIRKVEIAHICFDSREVKSNSLFVAVRGFSDDGHKYIDKAIDQGAVAILCEQFPELLRSNILYIRSSEARRIAGIVAHKLVGDPSEEMIVVGVTGTNGKTTVVTVLFQLFSAMGYNCGMLSTVHNRINDQVLPATHTTGDAVKIAEMMRLMRQSNCSHVFMEVSSHAVDQQRIAGIRFDGGIFTNISRDHLDYHGTMLNYINAKKKFFDDLPKESFALVNADDKNGRVMAQNTRAMVKTYGKHGLPDFRFRLIENQASGMQLDLCGMDFYSPLTGEFNAYNLTACCGAAMILGEDKMEIVTALSAVRGPDGRLEKVTGKKPSLGFVDYAHTPDALENVIETLKDSMTGVGKLIVVIGCGGNRDAGKRPIMAKIASEKAHQVIFTSDNPRDEDPELILDQMEAGVSMALRSKVLRITDRKMAIKTAVALAGDTDIILVAGKGHENYQEIKGEKLPFSDKEILKSFLDGFM